MQVRFVASVAPIVADPALSQAFYRGALGLAFEGGAGDYVFTERLGGVKHFGLWPLAEAARACFGTDTWPAERPVPQASLEFELAGPEAVADGAAELEASGYTLLHGARTEPWGQTVARLQSVEGLVVGLSYAPWLH